MCVLYSTVCDHHIHTTHTNEHAPPHDIWSGWTKLLTYAHDMMCNIVRAQGVPSHGFRPSTCSESSLASWLSKLSAMGRVSFPPWALWWTGWELTNAHIHTHTPLLYCTLVGPNPVISRQVLQTCLVYATSTYITEIYVVPTCSERWGEVFS